MIQTIYIHVTYLYQKTSFLCSWYVHSHQVHRIWLHYWDNGVESGLNLMKLRKNLIVLFDIVFFAFPNTLT